MREATRIPVLAGVLVGLLAALVAGLLGSSARQRPARILPGFDPAGVQSIEVPGGARGIIALRWRKSEGWRLDIGGRSYPADRREIEGLLAAARTLDAIRLAASDPKLWERFGVDEAHGKHIRLRRQGATPLTLVVGNQNETGLGCFVRVEGTPGVYEAAPNLSLYIDEEEPFWSALRLLPDGLKPGDIVEIGVEAHNLRAGDAAVDASYLLVQTVRDGAPAWIVQGRPEDRLDSAQVLSLASEIASLTADQFAAEERPELTGLDRPSATVEVATGAGARWVLRIGALVDGRLYAARADLPYVYLVNRWTVARAVPSLATLMPADAPASAP